MTLFVNSEDGQKQEASLLELHFGIRFSHVLMHFGTEFGHGEDGTDVVGGAGAVVPEPEPEPGLMTGEAPVGIVDTEVVVMVEAVV